MELGKTLREAREKKNLNLAEVEEAIKIRQHYLAALENEDYQSLPGEVYAVGFIKAYAAFLGLDAASLVRLFKGRDNLPPTPVKSIRKRKRKSTNVQTSKRSQLLEKYGWKVAIIILAIIIVLFWHFQLRDTSSVNPSVDATDSVMNQTATNIPSPSPVPEAAPAVNESKVAGIRLELIAQGDCWTQVILDGEKTQQLLLRTGERQAFTANKKIDLTLGDAGMVEVIIDGKSKGFLGKAKQVVREEFLAGLE